ncbi:MAG: insulinase family protein [Anaeromyxobacter sp.]
MRPNNATLVVVGDTTAAEIVPKLEKLFAGWQPGEVPKKNLAPVALPSAPRVFVVDRPAPSRAWSSPAWPRRRAPTRTIPQTALNTILGGVFISRLDVDLREDKHWSYGARTTFVDARGPRTFFAYAPVQADKTAEAVTEVRSELTGIRGAKPPTPDELVMAKSALTLPLPRALGDVAGELLDDGGDGAHHRPRRLQRPGGRTGQGRLGHDHCIQGVGVWRAVQLAAAAASAGLSACTGA